MTVAGYVVKEKFYLSGAGIVERPSVEHTGYRSSTHVRGWNSANVIRDTQAA